MCALGAGYGDTVEQAEAMRVLELPPDPVAGLLAALEHSEVAQIVVSQPQDLIPATLPARYGITAAMYTALRRGREIIAIQTGRPTSFLRDGSGPIHVPKNRPNLPSGSTTAARASRSSSMRSVTC